MPFHRLTIRSAEIRLVSVPLRRPVVSKVGSFDLMRVTETAHWLEWQDWADPVIAEPFELRNGHLVIPNRPGNGLAWNEDAVKQYRRDI